MTKKRSLTGIRATGEIHLGNYLGTIREALALQDKHECLYFIADLHSLTTNKEAEALRQQSYDVVSSWLAFGLNPDQHIVYRQSDIPMVGEFAWYLSCVTGMGFLQKAHSYKDATAKGNEVNHGVFAYPVLMAADILMYEPDVVPVGKDQKQHVEMARDMAGSINATFGEGLLKIPDVHINEDVMTIPGLDGKKMSKSYGNVIPLFSSDKDLKKKVMSITTDSTDLDAPKELDGTLLGELYKHFARADQYEDLKTRLAAGGLGWGHAKQEYLELLHAHLDEPRARYRELRQDTARLDSILKEGRNKALEICMPILNRVREAIGLKSLPVQFS